MSISVTGAIVVLIMNVELILLTLIIQIKFSYRLKDNHVYLV